MAEPLDKKEKRIMKQGDKVKVFTEVSDGQGDVTTAWIDGVVADNVTVQPGMKAHGNSSGIIVNAPGCAYKNKRIFVSDDLISTVVQRI